MREQTSHLLRRLAHTILDPVSGVLLSVALPLLGPQNPPFHHTCVGNAHVLPYAVPLCRLRWMCCKRGMSGSKTLFITCPFLAQLRPDLVRAMAATCLAAGPHWLVPCRRLSRMPSTVACMHILHRVPIKHGPDVRQLPTGLLTTVMYRHCFSATRPHGVGRCRQWRCAARGRCEGLVGRRH